MSKGKYYGTTYAGMAEAFSIFAKYDDSIFTTHAEHDLITSGPDPKTMSDEDKERLKELGWFESDYDCWEMYT
jgi:hypothetical protein